MKRPKLADMSEIEECRFRLLQVRRKAKRAIITLNCALHQPDLPPQKAAEATEYIHRFETVIKVTKPAWVRAASPHELMSALRFIAGQGN